MTQQTKNPIDKIHREAWEKAHKASCESIEESMHDFGADDPLEMEKIQSESDEAAIQSLANSFPLQPLTEEQEKWYSDFCNFLDNMRSRNTQDREYVVSFYEGKMLLSIIQKLRQQGDSEKEQFLKDVSRLVDPKIKTLNDVAVKIGMILGENFKLKQDRKAWLERVADAFIAHMISKKISMLQRDAPNCEKWLKQSSIKSLITSAGEGVE